MVSPASRSSLPLCSLVRDRSSWWLSSSGISLSSERMQRKLAKEQVGNNLEAETVPFSFGIPSGGEELRVAAHVFIPNLVDKLTVICSPGKHD